ncbi:MAG: phosphoribosylformylglycinamidine synthase, partial [Parasphingorhabdus sp.]
MLVLDGGAACSAFRLQKLLDAMPTQWSGNTQLSATYRHYVSVSQDLDNSEARVLDALLHYGSTADKLIPDATQLFVIPRAGTISPWSTKATDIAHHCGLTKVIRIERGVVWNIISAGHNQQEIENAEWLQVLFDPMIEILSVNAADSEDLFQVAEPAPFRCVDILGKGKGALIYANRDSGYALSDAEMDYLCDAFVKL